MPYRLVVHADLGTVFTQGLGEVTHQEVLAFRRELVDTDGFAPSFRQILDLRLARYAPKLEALRELADDDPFAPESRRALVVADDLQYGLARIYGTLCAARGKDLRPFRTLEEACLWLDVPLGVAEAALAPGG